MGDIAPYVPQSGSYPGTYPIQNSDISNTAAIAKSKLAALNITDADVAAGAAIAKSKLAALGIVNADVAAGAAIAYAKLALTGAIVDADIAAGAAISKSKLGALNIANADVAAGAAIAQSKLSLAITNSEVAAGAGIAKSKLGALGIVDADVASGAAIAATKVAPPAGAWTQRAGAAFDTNYQPSPTRPTLVIASLYLPNNLSAINLAPMVMVPAGHYYRIANSGSAGGSAVQIRVENASPPTVNVATVANTGGSPATPNLVSVYELTL